ncbi:hypothetical protein V6S63_02105 [Lactococcus lactis]|uniref:Uncharacterized protein n=1 Tax=Lactococcus lactis subsp. lactis TaxID=1360 RepID=A0A0V8EDC5_LACLL|nr:hypothetical protein [Lactococcus lactis]KSU23879.1 hypothetical protein N42_2696 [Lactococcus lactis subsp. lactis]MDU0409790.1 hypothetical protein [Lactococcus lactis]
MDKTQLKKLLVEAGQELEQISKLNLETGALASLYKETKKNEELQQDIVLYNNISEVTKRGGFAAKNLKGASTAAKNALAFVDESLAKLK